MSTDAPILGYVTPDDRGRFPLRKYVKDLAVKFFAVRTSADGTVTLTPTGGNR